MVRLMSDGAEIMSTLTELPGEGPGNRTAEP